MHGDAGSRYQEVEVRRRRVLAAVLSLDVLPRFSIRVVFVMFDLMFWMLNSPPPPLYSFSRAGVLGLLRTQNKLVWKRFWRRTDTSWIPKR